MPEHRAENIEQRDANNEKPNGMVQVDLRHYPTLLVRVFGCPITNAATPKQNAAVMLIDSKGSHAWT
jgi:hypothetical protein